MQNTKAPQTCRLCGAFSDLKNSHVYSEFLYKPLYDHKHRATKLDVDGNLKTTLQKGIREPMLCSSCEQHLSKIERRFKIAWYDENRLPNKLTNEFLELKDLDYVQFKLFHLSILWRSSAATIAEFNTVRLGPHQDKIGNMLLRGSPGPEATYRFWGQVLVDDHNRIVHDYISRPQASRLEGHHVYYACYGGCEWTYFVSSHSTDKYKKDCFRKDGSIRLLRVPFIECNTMRIVTEQLSSVKKQAAITPADQGTS